MSNFDIANIALQSVCPNNEMLYDDKGMPSVMVKIPKCSWADLGIGTSTATFPAFIVNGVEKDCIYFSKYQNIVQNSRAYSLPGQDPGNNITLDTSISRCTAKGEGWHLQTKLEWMAVALWCLKNGTQPKGNNNYGRDVSETVYKAIPSMARDSSNRIQRVATGTGPLTWSHDGTPSGIWDMNGNVSEWVGGIRLVKGELQVISKDGLAFGNDAADPTNSQSATSSLWYAIDGTTGDLITPDGNGTTANSLKADWVSSAWKWITGTITSQSTTYHSCSLESVTADSDVCEKAQHILMALGMLPISGLSAGALNGDQLYLINGEAERSFICGGGWTRSASAGVFYAGGSNPRTNAFANFGFRSAYTAP